MNKIREYSIVQIDGPMQTSRNGEIGIVIEKRPPCYWLVYFSSGGWALYESYRLRLIRQSNKDNWKVDLICEQMGG